MKRHVSIGEVLYGLFMLAVLIAFVVAVYWFCYKEGLTWKL